MSKNVPVAIDTQDSEYLYKLIERKRKKLLRINKRYEKLNTEIGKIQDEYNGRIGTLFRKSSLLDKEIQRYQTINRLIQRGLSFDEALLAIETEEAKKRSQEDDWEYLEMMEDEPILDESKQSLRRLWIKLVRKYHPDHSDDHEEKKKREQIMKVINKAYSKKDFKALQTIEHQDLLEKVPVVHTENLEQTLVDLENAIIRLEKDLMELKRSEWYAWRKKTQMERDILFTDLERSLVRETLQKEFILDRLKRKHEQV